jgi:transcriptional regulator
MYMPQQFAETRPEVLHELMKSHPLSTFVVVADGELVANHIPLLLDATRGEHGTLYGHVSRSNPVWRHFGSPVDAIAIFQGPQAYITPNWYPSKQADGKVVPTWDYAVVHAYGQPRVIEDKAWLLAHVTQLTGQHEAGRAAPWHVSDAPTDYIEQMLKGIVGIEMPITRVLGKWKVSQNRKVPDRLGVAAGLEAQAAGQPQAAGESAGMAALVRERA